MFNLKVSLLLVAVTNCIFLSSCLDLEKIESHIDDQVVAPVEAEVKINWTPVWDDIEGNNEFVGKDLEEDGEDDDQKCKAPNGLGLQNLFKEIKKILPEQKIKSIVKSYSEDPEIKALKAFIANPQTQQKVKDIHNSKEYKIFKDYTCRVLHIDLVKYSKLVRSLIQPLLITRANDEQSPKGIQGLMQEINAIIPRQQIRELYHNLLALDDELVKAVANLKSNEYRQLLLNIKNNVPEYKVLRNELKALGVPVDEMRELLANAFGWAPELDLLV